MYTNPPTQESAPEGPTLIVDGRGNDKTSREQSKCHCSLSDPSPTYSVTVQLQALPRPGEYLKLHPLYVTRLPRQKEMAQMKEELKAPEKNTTK